LDSICPTGSGKVAGVKSEIDEEKWAGGAEATARFEQWSAVINGISREKRRSVAKASAVAKAMADKMEGRQMAGLLGCSRIFEMSLDREKYGQGNGRDATKSLRNGGMARRRNYGVARAGAGVLKLPAPRASDVRRAGHDKD
jgi:hypothetical protein